MSEAHTIIIYSSIFSYQLKVAFLANGSIIKEYDFNQTEERYSLSLYPPNKFQTN